MSRLSDRRAEAQVAMMLLTRLPAGHIGSPAPRFADAAWAFPLAGLAMAAVSGAALALALALGVPAAPAAGVALAAGVLATGGIHEDGLADCADGFGGGHDRARKLEIMRDSRIGSYGGLAAMLSLGLRWTSLAAIAAVAPLMAVLGLAALAMASRAGIAVGMARLKPARSDGLGHMASGAGGWRVGVALALGALGLATLGAAAPVVLVAIALAQAAMAALAIRQIGGQTGDVLGGMQQVGEIAGWLALAAWVTA
ncbi:adenosylcobinamide-GDP ribazoletransferase [Phaeovulum vinaykumarii]|uniref:Adenosylcobinamide-GDP ribazoletransferase n=1 Tax=Phaeovulum vinaykumarii TaxID=407234 RepID=A0A1N7KC35_9RHOB|nr:adenosylcobinamide-GDP ribazoletransferase [Phaeovulum vinaykumarii]SIS59113.1 cobalamin-5'-phosphate synthase [Phaeovulum vinaykumarii]SOB94010.1 cobalamin-5'-phosphate synthase [Phaeovulum vinaykumarii]